MTDLLVKWPSRGRPRLFAETFKKWDVGDVRFLVSLDSDDPALFEYRAFLRGRPNVTVRIGASRNKVHACNRDLDGEPFDVLVLASDDMVPQRADWAARVVGLMRQYWPDGDGVLHLNDGRAGRSLNTLCICGNKYFLRFGYLYHPHYVSLHCDNEWQEVSERLGRAQYVDECIIRHNWIGDTPDELCRRNESFYDVDGKTFQRRQAAAFPR
jgi:hypothetical protein